MSDYKVFIFGSFTEDETRLFQSQSTLKCPARHSEKVESQHASEKIQSQFGSLDVASSNSVNSFYGESKQTASIAKSRDIQLPNLIVKGAAFRNEKSSGSNDLQKCTKALSNGIPRSHVSEISGSVEETLDLNQTCETRPDNVVTPVVNETIVDGTSDLNDDKFHRSENSNKPINTSVDVKSAVDVQKKVNEQPPPARSLLPRGLVNLGNLCFLNATLQALLYCSPFVQLLHDLASRNIPKAGYPTLLAFVEFISDFSILHDSKEKKHGRGVLELGKPFSPIMFDPVLKIFTPDIPSSLSGRPRQEDAQEFLSFIMDQMHDELLKLEGNLSSLNGGRLPLVSSSEDDGWETVGPKNKSAITRTQSFIPSELSAIFGGQLKSVVKATGNKASATVQPFLLLHLDILSDVVHTIEDALHLFCAPEKLEGYRASAGKAGVVSASKSIKIQTLSKILILHLMRFSYGNRGSAKLHKPVHFPLELLLARDLLVTPNSEGRKYELVATITHHGQDPSMGHYTADVKYSDGQWLRYDDSSVTAVGTNKVLHDSAYVLFYRQV